MFYCEPCRVQHSWPQGLGGPFSMSHGRCEICGQTAECHDVPSSHLPDSKKVEPAATAKPAGHKKRKPVCTECKCVGILSEKYDAYFCEHCNIWLESACPDSTCTYCKPRPSKPMEVACTS